MTKVKSEMNSLVEELDDGAEVQVVLASRDMLPTLAAIYNEYIADEVATFGGHEIDETFFDRYFNKVGKEFLLVAKLGDTPIGWTAVQQISDRWAYRFTGLTSMYVRKGLVAKQVGTALKLAQMSKAQEVGFHSLVCEVLSNNPKTINFNAKFGYETIGEIKDAGYRDGEWIGLTVMQKIISDDLPVERRIMIHVETTEIGKSIEFYGRVLGLGMRPRKPSSVSFPFGEVELEVTQIPQQRINASGARPTLGLAEDDPVRLEEIRSWVSGSDYEVLSDEEGLLEFSDLNGVVWRVGPHHG